MDDFFSSNKITHSGHTLECEVEKTTQIQLRESNAARFCALKPGGQRTSEPNSSRFNTHSWKERVLSGTCG